MEMRRTIACIALAIAILFAGFVAGSPDYNINCGNSQTAKQTLVTPSRQSPNSPSDNVGESDCYSPHWYTALKRPEWLGILVGTITFIFIGWQSWETRKSAEAAQDNIGLLLRKERARLEMIVGDVPVVSTGLVGVTCSLNNIGPTVGFIEGGGVALIEGPREIETDFTRCSSIPFVGSILGNSRTSTQTLILLQPDSILTDARVLEIRQGQSFIHCYGYVRYRDLFGRKHRARIHLLWIMRFGGMMQGQIMQWWEATGKPEENSDTDEDSPN